MHVEDRPPARRVTIEHVSRAAGVSRSTVSRVVNGVESRIPIGLDTRERVLRVVRELGYRPDPLARGLRGGGTALLGLLVREVTDPFFAWAIQEIASEAGRRGYRVVLGPTHSGQTATRVLSAILETRHCEAIILLGEALSGEPGIVSELRQSRLPLVALCTPPPWPGVVTIRTDNQRGAQLALEHLYELGHRRIALLGRGLDDFGQRVQAYRAFVASKELRLPDGYEQPARDLSVSQIATGDLSMRALLALPEPPTAVFAITDQIALGALSVMAGVGLRAPKDLSIVGFDDIPLAAHAAPPLSTVRQPIDRMARHVVDVTISLIQHKEQADGPGAVMDPELVVRASTGPPSFP